MADFDTNDIVRLGCVQRFQSVYDIVNVLHVKIISGGGLAFAAASQDIQQYCGALFSIIEGEISDDQVPLQISISNVTQATVWGGVAWTGYSGGQAATDPTATQLAMLAYARTSIPRVQIRKYLGVFTEAMMTGGLWSAGVRSLGNSFITYHITPQAMTNGLVLQGVAWNPSLSRAAVGISVGVSIPPVVQRRRRIGTGS